MSKIPMKELRDLLRRSGIPKAVLHEFQKKSVGGKELMSMKDSDLIAHGAVDDHLRRKLQRIQKRLKADPNAFVNDVPPHLKKAAEKLEQFYKANNVAEKIGRAQGIIDNFSDNPKLLLTEFQKKYPSKAKDIAFLKTLVADHDAIVSKHASLGKKLDALYKKTGSSDVGKGVHTINCYADAPAELYKILEPNYAKKDVTFIAEWAGIQQTDESEKKRLQEQADTEKKRLQDEADAKKRSAEEQKRKKKKKEDEEKQKREEEEKRKLEEEEAERERKQREEEEESERQRAREEEAERDNRKRREEEEAETERRQREEEDEKRREEQAETDRRRKEEQAETDRRRREEESERRKAEEEERRKADDERWKLERADELRRLSDIQSRREALREEEDEKRREEQAETDRRRKEEQAETDRRRREEESERRKAEEEERRKADDERWKLERADELRRLSDIQSRREALREEERQRRAKEALERASWEQPLLEARSRVQEMERILHEHNQREDEQTQFMKELMMEQELLQARLLRKKRKKVSVSTQYNRDEHSSPSQGMQRVLGLQQQTMRNLQRHIYEEDLEIERLEAELEMVEQEAVRNEQFAEEGRLRVKAVQHAKEQEFIAAPPTPATCTTCSSGKKKKPKKKPSPYPQVVYLTAPEPSPYHNPRHFVDPFPAYPSPSRCTCTPTPAGERRRHRPHKVNPLPGGSEPPPLVVL
eukprot:TRINITY_DN10752_c0_g1_i1.p1 TRINITY_DN10752_c0_g1~~TRINITY_DN10752_c0_g1_i1.p1  ORF type:complete len:723 (+),score=245.98 TRINITY_DN10752_c0_g1_i1:41-2170(+)